jgi:hypothetical protein
MTRRRTVFLQRRRGVPRWGIGYRNWGIGGRGIEIRLGVFALCHYR